jgi:cytochrome c peroxidase
MSQKPSRQRRLRSLFLLLGLFGPLTAWGFDYFQPLPQQPPLPQDNPPTAAKIALGKRLFFDPRLLGADSDLSCNSCHNLAQGGSDHRPFSIGQHGRRSKRSAPGLWNIGFQTVQYWDGRATSLEGQTLDHLRDPLVATAPSVGAIVQYLLDSKDYPPLFQQAFSGDNAVSGDHLAKALASFERSLLARNSPFDRFLGGDRGALSASAQRGMHAFNEVGCLACHFGTNFAGPAPGPAMGLGDAFYELFPNHLGTKYQARYHLADDRGRFEYTGDVTEKYMWRVPPLRNIARTAPYFHNGSVKTLPEAVRVMAKTELKKELPDATVQDIVAFLDSLTGDMSLK